ncbi:MAG: hypothetical protein DRH03_06635 [Deltaproteobacteria bacterium]|nr:MAG: hypothetical protein DRH03_06635 [Deltaproteobacteria bacterium]
MKKMTSISILILITLFLTTSTLFAADKLIVKNASGDAVVTLQDEGRIMVGTDTWSGASWAALYGVREGDNVGFDFASYGSDAAKGGGAKFTYTRGSQASPAALQNGDRLGFFLFGGYDGSAILNTAGITAKVDGAVSGGNVPTKFAFETNGSGYPRYERLTVASDGKVTIGNATDNPARMLEFYGGTWCDGNDWYPASSRDYKEEIEKLDPVAAMQTLNELEPVTYRYKNQQGWERKRIGFIAEDMPDTLAIPGKKGLSNTDIIATLTQVVKEQQKSIALLNSRLQKLEN